MTSRPWTVPLGTTASISVPKGGSGALIYYQGYSEPETAAFIQSFLKPGMVFYDVGAHIGEYVLLAAAAVTPSGFVHAFEPSPAMIEILESNVAGNRHTNVIVNETAVSDREGTCTFDECVEPAVSSMRSASRFEGGSGRTLRMSRTVKAITLDHYAEGHGDRVDLIKIDVEGAELQVLQGATGILSRSPERTPCLIVEYSVENYSRFGYSGAEVVSLLERHGFGVWQIEGGRLESFDPQASRATTVNLIASKRPLA